MRVAFGLACFVAASCAPIPPSPAVSVSIPNFAVGETHLPSGLYIVVESDRDAGAVSSAVVVGAGAADDPPGQEGLAHLVEHLAFRSHSPREAPLASRLALQGIGEWNAETSMDTTIYYQVGAPQSLESMLQADIARMSAPLRGLDAEQFAAERGVVINELLRRDETGRLNKAQGALFEQLFASGTPYARSVGGTTETLSKLTLEDAQKWVAQHYRPSSMTWVIAGDFDAKQVATLLEKLVPSELVERGTESSFASGQTVPVANSGAPPKATPQIVVPLDHRELLLGWMLPPARDRIEPVLSSLPGFVAGRAWLLKGVANADAQIINFKEASVLTLSLRLKDDATPDEIVDTLRKDWSDFWREGSQTQMWWIERSFVQIRAAAIVSLARANESILNRTTHRALGAHFGQSARALEGQYNAIAQLTFKEILDIGRTYVVGDRVRAVVLLPSETVSTGPGTVEQSEPPAFAPSVIRAEYPDEAIMAFARGPGLAAAFAFTASNGLQVDVVPSRPTGIVSVSLAVRGGRRTSQPFGLPDRLRWSVASESYGSPESLGASFSQRWTDDAGCFSYRASAGNLPNVLAILAQRLLTWRAVDVSKSALTTPQKPDQAASFDRLFWRSLEGESALPARLPDAEAAALDGSLAQDWLDDVLDPKQSLLVIAGDVRGSVQQEVEHWLARWKGPKKSRIKTLPSLPPAPGALRVLRTPLPNAKQVVVRFGCVAVAKTPQDEIAFELLSLHLQEQWTTLERETLGSSYGFTFATTTNRDGTMEMLVGGRVENKGIQRMAVATQQAWRGLPDIGAARLKRLRWEFAREYSVRFLTSGALSNAIVAQWMRGRPPSALDDMPQTLMVVTELNMQGIGRQCQASAVVGFLGDSSALNVEAQLPGAKPITN